MREQTRQAHRRVIRAAVFHIETNLGRDLDLGGIARHCGMAPHYFHRRFREIVGEPPIEHVRRLRLERAAWRIWSTQRPVCRLAMEAGYDTHEGFTRAFRARFGAAPREFRGLAPTGSAGEIEIRRVESPAIRIACLRHVGPYDGFQAAFAELFDWARTQQLRWRRTITLFLDSQRITAPTKTRCEVAIELASDAEPSANVRIREIPEREYLVAVHRGPYEADRLREAYEHLLLIHIPALGREPADAECFETYPGSFDDRALPLETWIHAPLAQRR